jgi:hypothetical protein
MPTFKLKPDVNLVENSAESNHLITWRLHIETYKKSKFTLENFLLIPEETVLTLD